MFSVHSSTCLMRRLGVIFVIPAALIGAIAIPGTLKNAEAQPGRAITIRSDLQEANSKTGVITASGNVQINYPARQIQATAAQAQYFSSERIIVLRGNVYVLQSNGNSIRGEEITYLMDEERFVATPKTERQVESIYIISDTEAPTTPTVKPAPPYNPKPVFKEPESNP
ncbi:MAG: LptA/OstA family protein [Spirulinaceae cyanobacterium]